MKKHNKTKKTNKRKLNGGLKQKNPSLTSWQSVYKMIQNPEAVLTKVAYTSLKGFIFRLDVPQTPENSEFLGLNAAGSDFTVPIYSLIFKFAIISGGEDDLELPNLKVPGDKDEDGRPFLLGRVKECENLNEFKTESNIQQSIYLKTINPSGKPICLSVVDFSTFNSKASTIFLRELLTKTQNNVVVNNMLQYLIKNVAGQRGLGLITMELANPEFTDLSNVENRVAYNNDCNYALAQIFILFLKLKIFNYDCHPGNVMATRNPEETGNEVRTALIDFGRTVDFKIPYSKNSSPFPSNSREIVTKYENLRSGRRFASDLSEVLSYDITSLYVDRTTSEDEVIDRMQKIIQFFAYVDYATNTTYFNMDPEINFDRPQLIGFLKYLYGPSFTSTWIATGPEAVIANFALTPDAKEKYARIIPTLRSLTEAPIRAVIRLSNNAIKRMLESGELFSVKPRISYDRSNVADWASPSEPVLTPARPATRSETATLQQGRPGRAGKFSSGGRKNYNRTRKYRK